MPNPGTVIVVLLMPPKRQAMTWNGVVIHLILRMLESRQAKQFEWLMHWGRVPAEAGIWSATPMLDTISCGCCCRWIESSPKAGVWR